MQLNMRISSEEDKMKTLLFTIILCVAFQQGISALKASDAVAGATAHKQGIELAMSNMRK